MIEASLTSHRDRYEGLNAQFSQRDGVRQMVVNGLLLLARNWGYPSNSIGNAMDIKSNSSGFES